MKIGVLLKQTPDTGTTIKVKSDASGIEEEGIKWVINPYDEYAVEESLRIKEKLGAGEVVIVSVGPKRANDAIRQAMAMGADRGIRIDVENQKTDGYLVALALSKIVSQEKFDLVMAGKQAVDDDAITVPHGVAETLGWPCVWPVDHVELNDDKKSLTVSRPIPGGAEMIEVTLPGIICCDKGENEPRYASLPGIMKAKSKSLSELKFSDFIGGEAVLIETSGFALPPERQMGKILEGEVEDVCSKLVKLLREEAKVI